MMNMSFLAIVLLAAVQGFAELLPVSSSAHVILTEKLMGIDPTTEEMTFLLVMLHTGTMFAVLAYFWSRWKAYLSNKKEMKGFALAIVFATGATGIVGFGLKHIIEEFILKDELEMLFGNLKMIAAALFVVGVFIWHAGKKTEKLKNGTDKISLKNSIIIGVMQGLCLPFRGFSRSGSTISTALLLGISKARAEDFSFALAVVLTPPVIARELMRLLKAHAATGAPFTMHLLTPGFIGMFFSFGAGLVALRWLSSWIEGGRWKLFGYYCICFAAVVLLLSTKL